MERRRNLDQEYLSSVRSSSTAGSSSSSTGTVTMEHTSEAAAGFANLLRQRKIKEGDKESARIVDVGPGRSIVDALKRGYYGSSHGGSHLFRRRDDDDEAVQGPDRLGWRTFLAAVVLLLIGVVLLVLGLRVYLRSTSDAAHNGLEMIILGCLLFLPGIYAATVMVGAHFGWPGYRYQHLPTYDHDENESSQTL